MTQLILDGISLPEAKEDTYKAYIEPLGTDELMISGRLVKEIRGDVWHVSYSGGYFAPNEKNALLEICERGRHTPINCGFLRQEEDGETLAYSNFWVVDYQRPKFAWSTEKNGQTNPLWVGFAVELREVRPHD